METAHLRADPTATATDAVVEVESSTVTAAAGDSAAVFSAPRGARQPGLRSVMTSTATDAAVEVEAPTSTATSAHPVQPALFSELDGTALLLPRDEVSRRCTGASVERLESVRELILLALEAGVGVETIARRAGVSQETVRALKGAHWEQVRGGKREFAGLLAQTGMRWIGLARAKEHEATFAQLTIGAGIVIQRSLEVAAAAMGEPAQEKLAKRGDQEAEIGALADRLRALAVPAGPVAQVTATSTAGPQAEGGNGPGLDSASTVLAPIGAGIGGVAVVVAATGPHSEGRPAPVLATDRTATAAQSDPETGRTSTATAAAPTADRPTPPGGGPEAGGAAKTPMGHTDRGLSAKGLPVPAGALDVSDPCQTLT